jgi:hypothetical protein
MEREFELAMREFLGEAHFNERRFAFAYFRTSWQDIASDDHVSISFYYGKFVRIPTDVIVSVFESNSIREYVAEKLTELKLAGEI